MDKKTNLNCSSRVAVIVQARLGSTRFPNKVIKKVKGRSLLEILFERLRKSKLIDEYFLATTRKEEDLKLIHIAKKFGFKFVQGETDDVLSRFYFASQKTNCKILIRITGDCPLVDFNLLDHAIKKFKENQFDYLSNIDPPTFPDGLDIEIFTKEVLDMAYKNCQHIFEREHVTLWMRENPNLKKFNIKNSIDLSKLRLTVDLPEDYEVMANIFNAFDMRIDMNWQEIYSLYKERPELFNINDKFYRNEGLKMNKSQKMWQRAKYIIPGGNMLLSKRPEMFAPEKWPAYYKKAKGINIWDVDSKKYKDLSIMGIGTNLLGYANKEIDAAVSNALRKSNMSTLNCPEEVLLAEKLVEMHPWSEMVRFARTGGEANAIAIRIARAATGRDVVAICGYHGWHDWYLANNLASNSSLDKHLLPGLDPLGVPKSLEGSVKSFSYNKFDQLEKIVEENNLAAVKMEVQRNKPPFNSFLNKVRKICDDNGIVLIFDECTSGFRETFGGLHLKYKVNPDISIFGKALGNGYSITSVIGKRSVMQAAQSTFISSTFWTERIGPTAALKAIEIMEREKSWDKVTELGGYLKKGWEKIANLNNLEIDTMGLDSLAAFAFKSKNHLKYKTFIAQEMLKYGYLGSTIFYASTKHKIKVLDNYLELLNNVFEKISLCEKGLESIDNLLECNVCHDGFKRLN